MEVKIFMRLMLKRWWLILIILAVTVVSAALLTFYQTPIYSSAATYVVSPSSTVLNGTGYLSGLSVLGGQPTVANTYASIATSATVKQKASDALGLTAVQSKNLSVFSRVQTGTNVIEISVEGTNPLLVQTFTNKIGDSTIEYVNKLNGVYDLAPLDPAISPDAPIKPNKKLNLILSIGLGLILGVGVAFLTGLKEF